MVERSGSLRRWEDLLILIQAMLWQNNGEGGEWEIGFARLAARCLIYGLDDRKIRQRYLETIQVK